MKCRKCGSIDIRSEIRSKIDYLVMEEEYICNNCGCSVNWWAHGHFYFPDCGECKNWNMCNEGEKCTFEEKLKESKNNDRI